MPPWSSSSGQLRMSSGLTNPTAWPICYGDEVFLQLFESALGDGMLIAAGAGVSSLFFDGS